MTKIQLDETLTGNESAVTSSMTSLTCEDETLTGNESTVTSSMTSLTCEDEMLTGNESTVTSSMTSLACEDEMLTENRSAVTSCMTSLMCDGATEMVMLNILNDAGTALVQERMFYSDSIDDMSTSSDTTLSRESTSDTTSMDDIYHYTINKHCML